MPKTNASAWILFALLAGCAASAWAQAPTPAPEPQRPFIEASYLVAPERVGDFVLEDASYDAANKYLGAAFRYALEGHQETRFDIFVYPAGRMAQSQAIDREARNLKGSLEFGEKSGYYRDVEIVSEMPFPLDADDASRAKRHQAGNDVDGQLIAALEAARTMGTRLQMQYTQLPGEFPMWSNGYLFHRHLYFYKARISAARERIADADFQALADRGARALVSAIETINLGGCANATIEVDPNAGPEAFAEILVRRTAEIQGENCIGKPDDAKLAEKSKGAKVVTIEFSADDWKAR